MAVFAEKSITSERVSGIEPPFLPWQGNVITIIRHSPVLFRIYLNKYCVKKQVSFVSTGTWGNFGICGKILQIRSSWL